MVPIHEYSNWNVRYTDNKEQIEPNRKYIIICEGVNTETFYFRKLIDLRKQLGIHPQIDIRLWEKTEKDRDNSYPKNLAAFAEEEKNKDDDFEADKDKLVIIFDADIFENRAVGYEELLQSIEENGNIVGVTNPNIELFLLLHIPGSYNKYIKGSEMKFLTPDEKGRYRYSYNVLHDVTGMNSKKNPKIGDLAKNVMVAIEQEKKINQDIHHVKGQVSSNIGQIIENIINDEP